MAHRSESLHMQRRKPNPTRRLSLEQLELRDVPATYFVATTGNDAASGVTLNTPFRTIQHALDVARNPGDVVAVRGGVYHEHVTFRASGSAAGGSIVLKNYAAERPILDGAGLSGGDMVTIDNRGFVEVSGFEIRNNTGVNDGSGIRITGQGGRITIRNNVIHEMRGVSAMGITVYGTLTAGPIANLVIDQNQIYNCDPSPSEALTLNGNVAGFTVSNNLVHDVNNIGIDLIGGEPDINPDPSLVARNGSVRGNTVYQARSNYGGGYAGGIYVDGGKNITVENNTSYQNDMGIEVGAENAGITATNIVVRNNLIHHNEKAGLVLGGFDATAGSVRSSYFINNTVFANDTNPNLALGDGNGQLWIQYATGNVIANNIFVAGPKGTLLSTSVGDVNNTVDYNLWYSATGQNQVGILWHDQTYFTFGSYRTDSQRDQHSNFAPPKFADAAYHLSASSPAVDAGSTQTGWFAPLDREGIARPQGQRPDVGAYEYHASALTPALRRRQT
jgi:parallel beta-helix repeat protein